MEKKKKASYVIQGSQGYKQKQTIKQKRSSGFILTHCKFHCKSNFLCHLL